MTEKGDSGVIGPPAGPPGSYSGPTRIHVNTRGCCCTTGDAEIHCSRMIQFPCWPEVAVCSLSGSSTVPVTVCCHDFAAADSETETGDHSWNSLQFFLNTDYVKLWHWCLNGNKLCSTGSVREALRFLLVQLTTFISTDRCVSLTLNDHVQIQRGSMVSVGEAKLICLHSPLCLFSFSSTFPYLYFLFSSGPRS